MIKRSAKQIIRALESPTKHRLSIKRRLTREARIVDLVSALRQSQTPLTRAILCEILGHRKAKSAIADLKSCLSDNSVSVRAEAAAALARIGVVDTGISLLSQLEREPNEGVRQSLLIALGAVGYRDAEGALASALLDSHPMIRAAAAWSLGVLRAMGSKDALAAAMAKETVNSPRQRMLEALNHIVGTDE